MRDNLQVAQNQQKQCAYQHRKERQFQVNELVYLRLHLYKKRTIKGKGSEKIKPIFYGPYKVIQKVGEVLYQLELPMGSKIHNVFHVYCIKKVIGKSISVSDTLPPLDDEGQLFLIPNKILRTRERKL